MPRTETLHQAFNVGIVDKNKLHRTDLLRLRLAAETQTNLLARVTGEMFMRPGDGYIGPELGYSRLESFFRGNSNKALLEFSDLLMRVWVDDALVARPAVVSSVTNGDFSSGTGWTLSGGASVNTSDDRLEIVGSAKSVKAICKQQVTTSSTGVEHALRIVVLRGPVTFRCGSTEGGEEYIFETTLRTGEHSLAFTPSGSFWVQFQTETVKDRWVDSIQIEASGVMTLATLWPEADLGSIRLTQSLDVVFCAARGYRQQRIERRGQKSWSVVNYEPDDGPFQVLRSADVSMSVITGTPDQYALESSAPFFQSGHLGAIFRLFNEGAHIEQSLGAENTFTDPIRVTGVNGANYNDRDWDYFVTGTWVGTLKVQRSFESETTGFQSFRRETGSSTVDINGNVSLTNEDDDDNAIAFYRIGFEAGDYTSGVADIEVTYDGGGGFSYCRIKEITSDTVAQIETIGNFNVEGVTDDWAEGDWSGVFGYPSGVELFDGRLIWGGYDRLWGSISDAYGSFDEGFEGDAGPINRALATGGSNDVQWVLGLQRLLIGTDSSVIEAKTSSLDEILTPGSLTLRQIDNAGCADVAAIKLGDDGMFVDNTGTVIYRLFMSGAGYSAVQLSKLTTTIFAGGIVEMAVQHRPDTRVWIVTGDGNLVCCVYDPDEEVLCFTLCETDGYYESVTVMPDVTQDRVYKSVRRAVDGATVRYLEKMALDTEVRPADLCKTMDSFVVTSPGSTVVTGADHLEDKQVVAWADGAPVLDSEGDPALFTVASGSFTLPEVAANVVYGLPYRARYKSARLAYGVEGVNPTLRNKKLDEVGLILTDFVRAGVKYGTEFDNANHPLDGLRLGRNGIAAQAIVLDDVQDEEPFVVDGAHELDARICIEVNSPNTATFSAMTLAVTTN